MADEEKKPKGPPPGATGMIPNDLPGELPGGPPGDLPPPPMGDMPPGGGLPPEGPVPTDEPYGLQIMRHFHNMKMDILKEFDGLIQPLENQSVRKFLEQYLQFTEATLTKAEQLVAKEYKEHPPLEGAMEDVAGPGPEEEKSKSKKSPPKKEEKKGKEKTKEEPKGKKEEKKPEKKESEKVKEAKKKFLEARRQDILDRLNARRKSMNLPPFKARTKDMEGATTPEEPSHGIHGEGMGDGNEDILRQLRELLQQLDTGGVSEDEMGDDYMAPPPDEGKRMDLYHYSKLLKSRKGQKDMNGECTLEDLASDIEQLSRAGGSWGEPHRQKVKELIEKLNNLLTTKEGDSEEVEDFGEKEAREAAEVTSNFTPEDLVKEKRLRRIVDEQAKASSQLSEKLDKLLSKV